MTTPTTPTTPTPLTTTTIAGLFARFALAYPGALAYREFRAWCAAFIEVAAANPEAEAAVRMAFAEYWKTFDLAEAAAQAQR